VCNCCCVDCIEGIHCGGSINDPDVCREITWLDIHEPDTDDEEEDEEDEEENP